MQLFERVLAVGVILLAESMALTAIFFSDLLIHSNLASSIRPRRRRLTKTREIRNQLWFPSGQFTTSACLAAEFGTKLSWKKIEIKRRKKTDCMQSVGEKIC